MKASYGGIRHQGCVSLCGGSGEKLRINSRVEQFGLIQKVGEKKKSWNIEANIQTHDPYKGLGTY